MTTEMTTQAPGLELELAKTGEGEPERIATPSRWRIGGDVLARGTQSLPDFQRDMLRWLGRWASERNMSLSEVAAALKNPKGEPYSPDSVYQALTGRRAAQGANLQPFAEAVAVLRRAESEHLPIGNSRFIETPLTRKIFRVCERALAKGRMTFLFGPSQVGKTASVVEFQRTHNHGTTVLIRTPTRGGLTHFFQEAAIGLRIPMVRGFETLRRRILDCFDERMLLIVDEAHQCLYGRSESGILTLEFIREIHDRRKCGVVLVGTDVLREALVHNKVLRQLWLRRSPGSVVSLPHVVPAADLAMFAQAFGLEPAPDRDLTVKYMATVNSEDVERSFRANPAQLQSQITTSDGLGAWLKLLEDAQDLAKERQTVVRWSHVLVAWCLAKAAEEGGAL